MAICAFVFVYGLFRDTELALLVDRGLWPYLTVEKRDIIGLFMTAVSLAIAAVPEGLPAIVTICLALGMQQMIRRHALIRKLPAVETLGSTTVVCTDKTGTLTQNKMTVLQGWAGGRGFSVTGDGYAPLGQFSRDGNPLELRQEPDLSLLLTGGLLCNDADLVEVEGQAGETPWGIIGDPTEGALVVAAAKGGLRRDELEETLPRVAEIPFDSDRKRMVTIHRKDGADAGHLPGESPLIVFVKGAPDVVMDLCGSVQVDGRSVALSSAMRQEVLKVNRDMAASALRVLGVACRPLADLPLKASPEEIERNLTFLGLMGMIDPPRPEVIEAVKVGPGGPVRSVMVTRLPRHGEAIARQIGLLTTGGLVLTGAELDRMDEAQLAAKADQLNVCCRVSPTHKTRIVDALKGRGQIVAMTGDGVNDAPALKRANIGIAMGITGTDVSKEAADMILTDDNFASIVSAIEQGRIIYANIRKFVYFLLACNVGEILIVFGAMLLGLPVPLKPIHLLWLNLVSDGAPALALGMEKGEPDIMRQPPRPPSEPLVNSEMMIGIAAVAIVDALAILLVFFLGMGRYPGHIEAAQTMAFVTLTVSELLRAFTARSETHSLFTLGIASNRSMLWATGGSLLLALAVIYTPFLQPFFYTIPLTFYDWLFMLPFFFASPVAMELIKIYIRLRRRGA